MKKDRNEINLNGLLSWLLTAILVLALILFSGSVSESGAGLDRPRTELREASNLNTAKTVRLENAGTSLTGLFSGIQTWDFIANLFVFGSDIRVKIKGSIKVLATIKLQVKRFVKFYSNANSGEPDRERTRG